MDYSPWGHKELEAAEWLSPLTTGTREKWGRSVVSNSLQPHGLLHESMVLHGLEFFLCYFSFKIQTEVFTDKIMWSLEFALKKVFYGYGPQTFWFHGRQFFHAQGSEWGGFRMIWANYIYCALCLLLLHQLHFRLLGIRSERLRTSALGEKKSEHLGLRNKNGWVK